MGTGVREPTKGPGSFRGFVLKKEPGPFFGDADLSALATREGRELANALGDILRDVQFDLANRDLRLPEYGGDYEIRPFPLPASAVYIHTMKQRLRHVVKTSRTPGDASYARRILNAFRLFMFGESLDRTALEDVFGTARKSDIDEAFKLGLLINAEGQAIRMNGLSLFSRKLPNGDVIHAFADTPPHFTTRTAHQRVYIGADSYELLGRVSEMSGVNGYCVEMGSGSGIQLIAALKTHSSIIRAIGKERDRRAIHVSLFNAALNRVDEKMTVVDNDDSLQERSEEHTSELQSPTNLVCRLLL